MPVQLAHNGLPGTSGWLFPEYDFEVMEPEKYASTIMALSLENGRWDEVNWLRDHYGERRIRQWLRQRGFRASSRRSFSLWRLVLGIKRHRAAKTGEDVAARGLGRRKKVRGRGRQDDRETRAQQAAVKPYDCASF